MATDAFQVTQPGDQSRLEAGPPVSRLKRPGFWGAIAGMAVALLIAFAVVAKEMVSNFGLRWNHSRARIAQLQSRLSQTQSRLMAANHKIAELRRNSDAIENFNSILAAPDSMLIRLRTDGQNSVNGMAVVSRQLNAAAVEVNAIPGPGVTHFEARWILDKGAPQMAGHFDASRGDARSMTAVLQPPSNDAVGLIVLATQPHAQTANRILLQGQLRPRSHR
jgi:hypothetical protein